MPGDVVIENVDTEGVTRPVTVFVERMADFIGGAFEPYQIVRVEKAKAKAAKVRAESEIEIAELRDRAFNRLVEEQIRKQQNLEAIRDKAIPLIGDSATPERMDHDWIANTVEKSQNVSDEQMQEMWARILAGEANNPGTFSRKTINILADMDKDDAELFSTLCGFLWRLDGQWTEYVFPDDEFFQQKGINVLAIGDVESLGLVHVSPTGFRTPDLPQEVVASYFGKSAQLTLLKSTGNSLLGGYVMFNGAGRQLETICEREEVDGLFEFMCDKWEKDPNIESVRVLGEDAE